MESPIKAMGLNGPIWLKWLDLGCLVGSRGAFGLVIGEGERAKLRSGCRVGKVGGGGWIGRGSVVVGKEIGIGVRKGFGGGTEGDSKGDSGWSHGE